MLVAVDQRPLLPARTEAGDHCQQAQGSDMSHTQIIAPAVPAALARNFGLARPVFTVYEQPTGVSMRNSSTALVAVLAVGACGLTMTARASDFNPAGIYIGAGVGQSNLHSDGYYSNNYYGFSDRDTAWQLTVGARPISPVGVEYDYINFGSPSGNYGSYYTSGNSSTAANALFGVGYLPIPLPLVDIYGKLGVARLQANTTVFGPSAPFRQSFANTDLAYGVGTQMRFGNLAVRAEYERISDSGGDPDMLSVGVTFTF
jgi:opacity protein-like surface antigen